MRDHFLGRLRQFVDPAYSSRGREVRLGEEIRPIDTGDFHINDGIAPSVHAGPIIMVEQTATPNVKKTVHYASYVILALDENELWHAKKMRLDRAKIREGDRWVDNELERALKRVDMLENEKYEA